MPSAVPVVHQVSRASNSITVSWPQPDQTNGNILDYQLRYYDQVRRRSGGSAAGLAGAHSPHSGGQRRPGAQEEWGVRSRTSRSSQSPRWEPEAEWARRGAQKPAALGMCLRALSTREGGWGP